MWGLVPRERSRVAPCMGRNLQVTFRRQEQFAVHCSVLRVSPALTHSPCRRGREVLRIRELRLSEMPHDAEVTAGS